jgi:dipeptidyl-peptidase-4
MALRRHPLCLVLTLCLMLGSMAVYAQAPRTAHEESNYSSYTSYENMMHYLEAIRAASGEMVLGTYGKTLQGRDIPYAVFSRPPVSQPWEALASGKPVVLIMVRELVAAGSPMNRMLDKMVLVVVPSINPDGFETLPRATRGNSRGIDMNRDYVKLEQPELASYVRNIIHTWHPHLFVDGHNGCAYPYNVCYQGPSMASSDPALTAICDREIFPLINKRMEEAGYRSWYYSGGDRKEWRVGGYDARIGRNYGGLINSIAILFESPGGQPLEMATKSGIVAYQSVAEFVAANGSQIVSLVQKTRQETIALGNNPGGEVVVQMKYDPEDYKVSYLIGEGTGQGWDRPIVQVQDALLLKKPVPTQTRPRPYAYLLEARSIEAVRMLQRHNIHIEVLAEDSELEVELYRISGEVKYSHEYDHPASAGVQVTEAVSKKETFPKGTFVIPTGQALGRVVTHMLEPETNDNVVKWNTMDFALPSRPAREEPGEGSVRDREAGRQTRERPPAEIPIFKLMKPRPLPTYTYR